MNAIKEIEAQTGLKSDQNGIEMKKMKKSLVFWLGLKSDQNGIEMP